MFERQLSQYIHVSLHLVSKDAHTKCLTWGDHHFMLLTPDPKVLQLVLGTYEGEDKHARE